MIKIYTGLKGFGVTLLFIGAMFLFFSIFFWGISKVIELFLPILIVVAYLMIIVFVVGFLPATFLKDLRGHLAMYSLLMSHALGAATWTMSFFYVIKAFGFWGILLALLFQFLAPVALVGAALKGSWHIALHLSAWIFFAYGMKYYSEQVLKLNAPVQEKRDIIDVDAIEV